MRPFYKVASFTIDTEFKARDFRLNRHGWWNPCDHLPVFCCVTTVDHGNGSYHAEVNCYRRTISDDLFDMVVA